MTHQKLAALAAACALTMSGLSYGYDAANGDPSGTPGAGDIRIENGSNNHSSNNGAGDKPMPYGDPNSPSDTRGDANHHGDNNHGDKGYQHTAYPNDSDATGGDSLLKHGTGVSHVALLAGGNEVSSTGKADAGDPDGNGAAAINIDPEAGKICFGLVVNNIDGPVAAHIHQGRAGRNGPVVIKLKAPESGDPGSASGCVDNVDRILLQTIHAHPWAYYVNVHSGAYPDGAVRGQLH